MDPVARLAPGVVRDCDNCDNKSDRTSRVQFYHASQSSKIEPCNLCGKWRVKSPCAGCADKGLDECTAECTADCQHCDAPAPMYMAGTFTLCPHCVNGLKDAAAQHRLARYCSLLWWNAQA